MVGLLGGLNFIPIEDLEDREPLIIIFFVTNQIGILAPGSTTTIVFTSYFLSSHVYLSYSTWFERALEMFQNNEEKILRLVPLCSKMGTFVEELYPLRTNDVTGGPVYGKPAELSTCDAMYEIFTANSERFATVRWRLVDRRIEVQVFLRFLRWIYSQCSDKSYHKIANPTSLPSYRDKRWEILYRRGGEFSRTWEASECTLWRMSGQQVKGCY